MKSASGDGFLKLNYQMLAGIGAGDTVLDSGALTSAAILGISIEPLAQVADQSASVAAEASKLSDFQQFAQRMLENFFNYASSFAVQIPVPAPNGPQIGSAPSMESIVPLKTVNQWYERFTRQFQADPYFWRR